MEAPATNEAIAGEVFLSVDAVKWHLRLLFRKFEIEDLPQNQKRARLVRLSRRRPRAADRCLTIS